ncbi:PREDICTED: uncharacterized protein LOC105970669 [Erythranthe guttata]|uniref:uncharacterized protein LOC105970669 n=1 Tax=Erythranthe guttata TaxID=4155 RepID=UPI00064E044C|nr:PREDICTED: uncharacterized protein LOC105970669 [Erythranthe guttata]|eukprot:XP_012850957.1 PREDICTED: uncharacterized protein LOC105970669 [Erythranthe guttata]
MCIQEEVRLKQEGNHFALAVTHGTMKKKMKFMKSGKKFAPNKRYEPDESSQGHGKDFVVTYYFSNKKGHVKKDCEKCKAGSEKKGIHLSFVRYESNLIEVSSYTWWFDSGATTHITNSLQGFLTTQKPEESEKYICMGNRVKSKVAFVGTYRLILETGHKMDIENTFYVPSFSRNLVSLSKLDVCGYSSLIDCGKRRIS